MAGIPVSRNGTRRFLAGMQEGFRGGASDPRIEYRGAALALLGFLAGDIPIGEVVGLGDFVRQPLVHQLAASKAELLAPGAVFELVLQDLFEAEGGEIIAPI